MSPWSTCPTRTLESWISWWLVPANWHSPAMWSCSPLLQRRWTCSPTTACVATRSPRRCTAVRADREGPTRDQRLAMARLIGDLEEHRPHVRRRLVSLAQGTAATGTARVAGDDLLSAAQCDRDAGHHWPGHGAVRLERDVLPGHQLILHGLLQPAAIRGCRCHWCFRGQSVLGDHVEAAVRAAAGSCPVPPSPGLRAEPGRQGQRQ